MSKYTENTLVIIINITVMKNVIFIGQSHLIISVFAQLNTIWAF